MKMLIFPASVFCFLIACSGGISDDALLADLDADDWATLCEGSAQEAMTMTCDMDGTEVEVSTEATTEADCVSGNNGTYAGCTVTVGEYNACVDAFDAMDMCSMDFPSECEALMCE